MKKVAIPLMIAMLISVMFSCGTPAVQNNNVTTRDILEAVMAMFTEESHHGPLIYYADAEKGSDNYFDTGAKSKLFYGEYDVEMPEMDSIGDFALAMPSGLYAFEVDVFKAKTADDVTVVKDFAQKRLDEKAKTRGEVENYDAAQLPILDGTEVYVSGDYVFLIATEDNIAVKAKITEMLTADSAGTDSDGTDAVKNGDSGMTITNIKSSVNANITGGGTVVKPPVTNLVPSKVPVLTITSYSANNLIVLGGTCVQGAKIHVRGGVADQVFGTDYTNWLCEVEIPTKGVTTLSITQEEPGKGESEAITISLQARTDVDLSTQGVCQVMIGDNGQGHFFGQLEDWLGTNLLTDNQVTGVTSRIKDKVDYLAKQNCELVYVIVPNPMAIYPGTAPARYKRSTADTTRTAQFESAAESAGATVIDLSDILNKHKDDDFKIFHKTDSHWTDYGAYWGYSELMSYISKTWTAAAPLPIEGNFEFYHKEVVAGDMMTHLKIQNWLMKEYDTFVNWKIDAVSNPYLYDNGMNQLNFNPVNKTMTVRNGLSEADLPSAMIIRDSFSANIYGYLNNSFSDVYWQAMWDYKFDKSYIERTKPDYYIILVAERNIGNLLG